MIRIQLEDPFENDAGSIVNIDPTKDLPWPVKWIAVIHSGEGTRRSSHYHKSDEHVIHVVDGRMRYAERRVGDRAAPTWHDVRAGEAVLTRSGYEHWTEFPVATTLLSLSEFPRDHETHEADLVRVPWLED